MVENGIFSVTAVARI